ncbi:MAG: exopolysaccharide biosynthesis WecB/TagA/CpsF family protein [Oceanicoccus sp.]|jgi:exopolysaccharide biosynthesis WecB/TagA/CpsF family protein
MHHTSPHDTGYNSMPFTVNNAFSQFEGEVLTPLENTTLLDFNLCNTSMPSILEWIKVRAQSKDKTVINFVNAHRINTTYSNDRYRASLKNSDLLLPDGSGIDMVMKLRKSNIKESINEAELFPSLCEMAAENGLSVFLLGGKPGVAETLSCSVTQRFPGLKIAGFLDDSFLPEENDDVIKTINKTGADILLVAMGVPRQELWLADNIGELKTSINMGIEGLFDFYSNRTRPSPYWMRKIEMNWTWRLIQDPKRMWRRCIIANPRFLIRALLEARRQKRKSEFSLKQRKGSAWGRKISWWLFNRAIPIAKRLLDLGVVITAAILISPLLLVTILAIKIDSPGPILFHQKRIGLGGKTFKFWKFRSMYTDANERRDDLLKHNEMAGGVLFKMKEDPRITRTGRFIRRFSIDEIPQLWNVLRGDMSLVGPRPALPSEVSLYSLYDRKRLKVQPGITGIWQVSGRSNISFDQQVKMDIDYIQSASLTTDVQLLLKTIPAVISGNGAY